MSDARTVVIAAGGTGGHLFPAQSLAEELVRRGHKVILVTDERGRTFADRFPNVEIRMISAATFAGGALQRLGAVLKILTGTLGTLLWLGRVRPAAIIGFGGYPSLPTMLSGLMRRDPTCIHEANAILGRVNRRLAPFVNVIASAFPELGKLSARLKSKVKFTGNPVRDQIKAARESPYAPPSHIGPLRLFVFGGSQGARIFSEVVPSALSRLSPELRARIEVMQQCREEDIEAVRELYRVYKIAADLKPFFSDMADRLSGAHLIISRAGASTVTEIAVIGRPAILVPFPAATDDHQTFNAKGLVAAGGAWAVPQTEFSADRLAALLEKILRDPDDLARRAKSARLFGKPNAQAELADLIESLFSRPPATPAEEPAGA